MEFALAHPWLATLIALFAITATADVARSLAESRSRDALEPSQRAAEQHTTREP